MTTPKNSFSVRLACTVFCLLFSTPTMVRAESAIDLLGGFDAGRIEAVYPPDTDDAASELAKLAYRVRRIEAKAMEERTGDSPASQLGDATDFDGSILKIQQLQVPQSMVELLELNRLWQVEIRLESTDATFEIITPTFPDSAQIGDRIKGKGVVIEVDDGDVVAIMAARVSWFPNKAPSAGWQLLSQQGVDISLLADVASRNRKPLMGADNDAFYSMLSAAGTLDSPLPLPESIPAVQLLSNPKELAGQWLRMNLETVQITRISVTDALRSKQLGSDHYYQIDAVADLGKVVIRIERSDGDKSKPAPTFENRYPVSLVVRDLPEFLKDRMKRDDVEAVVADISMSVQVDGFFFRLWSYKTDFMKKFNSGDQFGPLIVASRIESLEPLTDDPAGVSIIGKIAGVGILLAIATIWWWQRSVNANDQEVREKRRQNEQVDF